MCIIYKEIQVYWEYLLKKFSTYEHLVKKVWQPDPCRFTLTFVFMIESPSPLS